MTYHDIPRNFNQLGFQLRQPHMLLGNQRLAIEGSSPNKNNMCIFHLLMRMMDHPFQKCCIIEKWELPNNSY